VGIAVSGAVDVAKAAASLVLTSPGLSNVVEAIETSRRIYQRMVTYTLNMSIKKIEIPLFLSLGLLLGGTFVVTPLLLILMIFANDFATMTITTDNVVPSRTPDRWSIGPLLRTALGFAVLLLALNAAVFWGGGALFKLSLPQAQTITFVWLVISSQANVYLVRERRRFWNSPPGHWLIAATIADIGIVSALAIRGWLMAAISPSLVAAALLLGVVYLLVAEAWKVYILRSSGDAAVAGHAVK
jgi:H+-transporting ATPase